MEQKKQHKVQQGPQGTIGKYDIKARYKTDKYLS